ncbi:MAG: terminase gpA endonuclease subunit [Waterburya sp.]
MNTYLGLDDEFYQQLCAEKLVTKYVKGYPKLEWVKTRTRNEALDTLCYAYVAAIAVGMARINWDKWEKADGRGLGGLPYSLSVQE